MRKYVGFLMLALSCSTFLQAESVWTGNAGAGNPQQFPGSQVYFRAASNAFPLGTILEVTNLKGRASIEVTVVKRLENPGYFLLMEINAAKRIGIPLDHIRPVQVRPVGSIDIGNYVPVSSGEPSDEKDSSTAEISPNSKIPPYLSDGEDIASSSWDESSVAAAVNPYELGMIDDLSEYNSAGEILNPIDDVYDRTRNASLIPDRETPDIESMPEEIPEDTAEEITEEMPNGMLEDIPDETVNLVSAEGPGSDTENPGKDESQLLFLSPSDFRPPAETAITTMEQTPLTAQEGDFEISQYRTGDKGKYIQVGTYQNREFFEARVSEIQQSNPDYPLKVAIESGSSGQPVYKLLVGPIKPAEIGVVLDTVKRNKFPDAFRFIR